MVGGEDGEAAIVEAGERAADDAAVGERDRCGLLEAEEIGAGFGEDRGGEGVGGEGVNKGEQEAGPQGFKVRRGAGVFENRGRRHAEVRLQRIGAKVRVDADSDEDAAARRRAH